MTQCNKFTVQDLVIRPTSLRVIAAKLLDVVYSGRHILVWLYSTAETNRRQPQTFAGFAIEAYGCQLV